MVTTFTKRQSAGNDDNDLFLFNYFVLISGLQTVIMARLNNADRKVTYGSGSQCNYEIAPGCFNFKGTAGQKGLTYKKRQKGLRRS